MRLSAALHFALTRIIVGLEEMFMTYMFRTYHVALLDVYDLGMLPIWALPHVCRNACHNTQQFWYTFVRKPPEVEIISAPF